MPNESSVLILCGPMVRRVDRSSVSVFLVLREAREVTLNVLGKDVVMSGKRKTIQLGTGVHAVTVTAKSTDALAWGKTYHYDLQFDVPGTTTGSQHLYDDGVLVPVVAKAEAVELLRYESQTLPSFKLPTENVEDICFWHGSCRKPHGDGPDALAGADKQLENTILQPERYHHRPQQFFFTGDQVYADDVHEQLAGFLATHAKASCGDAFTSDRKDTLTKAGFTSGNMEHHLVTLGEFYAMYLFVWSRVLWPPAQKIHKDLKDTYNALPSVRRLLANVSTLMMFDDHEVTDDWFISKEWSDKVLGNPRGRSIVRHALMAYAVFQHWGNVPDQFEGDTPGARLLEKIDNFHPGNDVAVKEIETLLGMTKSGAELKKDKPEAIPWGYHWQGPTYNVVMLDTRTHREFNGQELNLMTKEHIEAALSSVPSSKFTVVISPPPVLGLQRFEELRAKPWVKMLNLESAIDAECWPKGKKVFDHLKKALFERSPVVVLSGDIHFGISVQLVDKTDQQNPMWIVEFTSSALKNTHAAFVRLLLWADEKIESKGLDGGDFSFAQLAESIAKLETIPRVKVVESDGRTFEDTLLVGDVDDYEPDAKVPMLAFNADVVNTVKATQPAFASPPARQSVITAVSNFGEIRLSLKGYVQQTLYYYDEDKRNWTTRKDSSTFKLGEGI